MADKITLCIEDIIKMGYEYDQAETFINQAKKLRAELSAGEKVVDAKALEAEAIKRGDRERLFVYHERQRVARRILDRKKNMAAVRSMGDQGVRPSRAIEYRAIGSDDPSLVGGRVSAARSIEVIEAMFHGPIAQHIRQHPPLKRLIGAFWTPAGRKARKEFMLNVVREIHEEETGDKMAADFASVLSQALGFSRGKLNDHGALIGYVKHYLPQHSSPDKVGRNMEQWMKDIKVELDMKTVFAPLYDGSVDLRAEAVRLQIPDAPDEKIQGLLIDEILKNSWQKIVGINQDPAHPHLSGDLIPGGNIAKRFGKHRFFHFKDADSWIRYSEKYGTGDVLSATLTHLRSQARALGLMMEFGDNPVAMINSVKQDLARRMSLDADMPGYVEARPDLIKKGKIPTTAERAAEIKKLAASSIEHDNTIMGRAYREVLGQTVYPENLTMAKIGAGIRAMTAMRTMGRATISSFPDLAIVAAAQRMQGRTLARSWAEVAIALFSGRSRREMADLAYIIDGFSDGMLANAHHRFDVTDGVPGLATKLTQRFFKWTGLNWWTDNQRGGVTWTNARWMGAEAATKSYDQLDVPYKAALNRNGLDQRHWDAIRELIYQPPGSKHLFIVPEKIRDLSNDSIDRILVDEVAEARGRMRPDRFGRWLEWRRKDARERLEVDLVGFFRDEADYAVLGSDARTRTWTTWGTRPGTSLGEGIRMFSQLKAFPIGIQHSMVGRYMKGIPGRSRASSMAEFFSVHLTALMALGYMSLCAKWILDGREPRSFLEGDWKDSLHVAIASSVQGGGMGIYGDFLFGEYNRYGRSLGETITGATVSGLNDIARLWAATRTGDVGAARIFRTMWRQAPFVNMWWTKWAIDYFFTYTVMESLDPGALRRMEKAVEGYSHQDYIYRPSEWLIPGVVRR